MKSVLITGAGTGIGLLTARRLDRAGWRIFAGVYPGQNTAPLVEKASDNLLTLSLDVTDAERVHSAVETLSAALHDAGLDALVNNAGVNLPGPLEALSLETIRQQFEVNLFGHIRVTQAFLPLLRQAQRARIVNMSSLMGRVALPMLGPYSMSKHALEGFSDALRRELAPWHIGVTVVQPGAFQTPMSDNIPEQLRQTMETFSPTLRERYHNLMAAMLRVLTDQGSVSAELVARTVERALTRPRPPVRVHVGADAWGLLILHRLAPAELADAILHRALKLPRS